MIFTRKRKSLVAVLVLGVAALAVDRFVLTEGSAGPRKVHAAVINTSQTSTPSVTDDAAAASQASIPNASVAGLLTDLGKKYAVQPMSVKDAFRPSPKWLGDFAPQTSDAPRESGDPGFLQRHRLNAVVVSGNTAAAVINDQYLCVGQELDGYRLVKVSKSSAVLVSNGEQVTLLLDRECGTN